MFVSLVPFFLLAFLSPSYGEEDLSFRLNLRGGDRTGLPIGVPDEDGGLTGHPPAGIETQPTLGGTLLICWRLSGAQKAGEMPWYCSGEKTVCGP